MTDTAAREAQYRYATLIDSRLITGHEHLEAQRAAFIAGAEWRDAQVAELKQVLADVVARWDECLPEIRAAETLAYVHGWRYAGPPDGMKLVIERARALSDPGEEGLGQDGE